MIEVNVLALPLLSVEQVVGTATSGDIVKVKGIVVGFHWNGSSTLGTKTHGIILKDAMGDNLLYVIGLHDNYGTTRAQYVLGEGEEAHTLALGDEIQFSAAYVIEEDPYFIGRKTLVIASAQAANMQVLQTELAYSFDTTGAILIDSETALDTMAENLAYGQVYKLQGPFTLRGSASSVTGANAIIGFEGSDTLGDYDHSATWAAVPLRFTFKMDGNEPNLGTAWYETALDFAGSNYFGADPHLFGETSTIYFYVGNVLPQSSYAYVQLVILDSSHVDATRIDLVP